MEELEFDTMEECAALLREAQSKLRQLESKDEAWNQYICDEIDSMCAILVV